MIHTDSGYDEMNERILVTRTSMPPYEEYIEAIKPLWDSHWITNMGTYHRQLEQKLAEYLEVPEISLMVNGHMALELAIQAFEFPEGSEVITTPFTFISTTHAIVRNRLKPVFCDIKESDGTIDETKIEGLITPSTVAILPVHVYGNICNVEEIQRIADAHGLKVIYDAAHAFGERCQGRGIGNYGDASIFSFHATKVYNTIEGGAVVCKNHDLYEKLYNLKNFGIRGEEHVVSVGANAKMNEFSAIMGLCNLKHIEEVIAARRQVYEYYRESLDHIKGIRVLLQETSEQRNYAYLPIEIGEEYPITRDELYDKLRAENIYPRKYFSPITADQECYRGKYKNIEFELKGARKLAREVLVLPLFEGMTKSQAKQVMSLIRNLKR